MVTLFTFFKERTRERTEVNATRFRSHTPRENNEALYPFVIPIFYRRARASVVSCCTGVYVPFLRVLTFSRSWRSCLLLASLEHRLCSGATTVQIQRPSASWAELYTCQPSFGPMVCKHGHKGTKIRSMF